MKRTALATIALATTVLASGCVSTKAYNGTVDRLKNEQEMSTMLKEELVSVQTDLKEADQRIIALQNALAAAGGPSDLTGLKVDTSDLDAELAKIRDELAGSLGQWDLASGNAVGTRLDDGGELLFRSGSWVLNDSSKKNLDNIAKDIETFLASHPDYVVRVDGHTDADPIRNLKKKGITSNRQLAFMRANAVLEYLVSKGIPQERCSAIAFGEFRPVGSQKKLNRRVEIWLSTPEGFSYSKSAQAENPQVSR